MIDPELKQRIDSSSVEELLMLWRNVPHGDPMFSGETGVYFQMAMEQKQREIYHPGRVDVYQLAGWNSSLIE
jgi:hypothetical protein